MIFMGNGTTPYLLARFCNSYIFTVPNATDFTLSPGGSAPCASLTPTLAVGEKCTVSITFAPTNIGGKTANLTVSANDKNVDIPVTGTAITTIKGIVTDLSTGNKLAAATVTITGGATTQTDPQGSFIFDPLPANGVYSVTISKTGYGTATINNVIVSDTAGANLIVGLTTPGPLNIISTSPLLHSEIGTPYSQRISITGGNGPYIFTTAYGTLPPGLTLNISLGSVSGSPTTAGSYTFAVGVTDNLGGYAEREFSIEVTQPLVITTQTMPRGTIGYYYNFAFSANGGTQPYSYSITGGGLPIELFMLTNGNFIGKISDVVDFSSGFVSSNYWNTVGASLNSGALMISGQGNYATFTYNFSGGNVSFDWSKSEGQTQAGFSFYVDGVYKVGLYGYSAQSGTYTINLTQGTHTLKWINGTGYMVPANNWLKIDNIWVNLDLKGTYPLTVKITDASGRASSKDFSLVVDGSLALTTTRLNDGIVGSAFNQILTASGGYGSYTWGIYSGVLPAGLTLNPATGTITGTPTEARSSLLVFSVTDSYGRITYKEFTFNIFNPLQILTTAMPNGHVGDTYSDAVRISGGFAPYTYTITGQLPAGLTINQSTGIISGTPTSGGVTNVQITVTDSTYPVAQTNNTNLSIRIWSLLTITSSAVLPNSKKGVAISPLTLVAKGGTSPYTWSLTAGYLPDGINLDPATGVLSGTPKDRGDFVFTIRCTDSGTPSTADKQFFIHISDTLTVTTGAVPNGAVGMPYSSTLNATGGLKPYTWAVKTGTLPAGLSLNNATGAIAGTPTAKISSSVIIEVTDGDAPAQKAQQTLNFDVSDTLSIYDATVSNSRINQAYNVNIRAQLGTLPYTWRLASGTLPPGVALGQNAGIATLSGTPTTAGTYTFSLEVSDSATPVQKVSRSYTLIVHPDIAISTAALKTAVRVTPYADVVAAIGGALPYSFTIVAGTLPAGLTFNTSTGDIYGSVNMVAGQSVVFTVRATDSGYPSAYVEKQFTLIVVDPLVITTTSLQGGTQYLAYNANLSGQGGFAPLHWSVPAGTLPQGVSLNTDTGAISGTPTTCGSFPLTIQLADSAPAATTTQKALQINVNCVARNTMTVTLQGTGGGSVNSNPSGIACSSGSSTGCSAPFVAASGVTLMPTNDAESLFKGWAGACINLTGNCSVTMDAAKAVTATFDKAPLVKLLGTTPNYFGLILPALEAASAAGTIQVQARTFTETLLFNRPISVFLKGGYDAGFTSPTGATKVKGKLLIRQGTVRVNGLVVY
jgi:carboxypeptidase family protein/putative Ig domain-containing protein